MSHRFGNCLAQSLYILYSSYFAVHYSTVAAGLRFTLSFPVLLYSTPLCYPLYSAYFAVLYSARWTPFYPVPLLLCSYSLWSGLPYPNLSFSNQFHSLILCALHASLFTTLYLLTLPLYLMLCAWIDCVDLTLEFA